VYVSVCLWHAILTCLMLSRFILYIFLKLEHLFLIDFIEVFALWFFRLYSIVCDVCLICAPFHSYGTEYRVRQVPVRKAFTLYCIQRRVCVITQSCWFLSNYTHAQGTALKTLNCSAFLLLQSSWSFIRYF